MSRGASRRGQSGISILEVVIALLVLGLLTVAAWKLQSGVVVEARQDADGELVTRADQALRTFIARNSRLPCPAADNTGTERCVTGMAASTGFVPWVTVGLPDAGAGSLRYVIDTDALAQSPPGLGVLSLDVANGTSVVGFSQDSTDRTIHWCNLVGKRMKAAPTGRVPRAYQVFSAGVDPQASATSRPMDAAGAQITRTLPELWNELNCGALVAGAARAYINAALAARMMALAAQEQLKLSTMNLDTSHSNYNYDLIDLIAEAARQPSKVANALMGCANAASLAADAIALTATPPQWAALPVSGPLCVSSVADLAVHIASLIQKIQDLGTAGKELGDAAQLDQTARNDEATQAAALADAIAARARAAIAEGMDLE